MVGGHLPPTIFMLPGTACVRAHLWSSGEGARQAVEGAGRSEVAAGVRECQERPAAESRLTEGTSDKAKFGSTSTSEFSIGRRRVVQRKTYAVQAST